MTETGEVEAVLISDFLTDNMEKFSRLKEIADQGLNNFTRNIPVDLFQEIRDSIFIKMLESMDYKMKAKLVIDSNIIVQDAFRVASGKISSTERILSSPFLEVCAPPNIVEETKRKIREKLPKSLSLRKAQYHARRLLSRISLVDNISNIAFEQAHSELSENAPEDIPFLAVAIESKSEGIVSRDKRAFDKQDLVKRWEMKDTAQVCINYESGSFVLMVGGISFGVVIDIFHELMIVIASAMEEAVKIIASFVAGFIGKSIEALQKIPVWAWALLGAIGFSVLIAAILSSEFREWAGNGIARIIEIGNKIIENVVQFAWMIWHAFKTIIIMIWNFLLPVTIVTMIIAGVLFKRIMIFIDECQKENGAVNKLGESGC